MINNEGSRSGKICFDISDLLEFSRKNNEVTGIQRVSLKAIRYIVENHGQDSIDLVAFDTRRGGFRRTDAGFFVNFSHYEQVGFCRHFGVRNPRARSGERALAVYLNDKSRGRLGYAIRWLRLHFLNLISRGRVFERRGIVKEAGGHQASIPPARWRPATFTRGDRLFIPGATWEFRRYNDAVAELKGRVGLRVYQFVHDLIPLVTPEHLGPGVPRQFETWFRGVLDVADVILANSAATAGDIRRFSELTGAPLPVVRTVPLAHEFEVPQPLPEPRRHIRVFNDRNLRLADHATVRVLSATLEPYALAVGTIESRKNILRLLMVWQRLSTVHGPKLPRLVLAGKKGVFIDDILGFLDATGYVGGRVRVIERPGDGEVAFLFANCLFSICISYYEGWGLPIGESLWFGRPVLASNTSSMPEVGGDLVDYVDPTDSAAIEAKLDRLLFDAAYREGMAAALAKARLRTWNDVSQQLWREVTT